MEVAISKVRRLYLPIVAYTPNPLKIQSSPSSISYLVYRILNRSFDSTIRIYYNYVGRYWPFSL
jgi:hypothetical protein